VSADEVPGSGCQVAIEITDTSDPRGGQPGDIGIDLTLPDGTGSMTSATSPST
jgi:hypothetical protein